MEEVRTSTDDIYTLAQWVSENLVAEAYLSLRSQGAYPITITATPATLAVWDSVGVTANKRLFPNLPNGVNFTQSGTFRIGFVMATTFTEVNAGRTLLVRLWNSTTGTQAGQQLSYAVGRNTPGITIVFSTLAGVVADPLSQNIVVQISSADSFTNFVTGGGQWSFNHVGRFGGDDPVLRQLEAGEK
jgi:hypothetical protein